MLIKSILYFCCFYLTLMVKSSERGGLYFMLKKLLSFASVGILATTISFSTVNAEAIDDSINKTQSLITYDLFSEKNLKQHADVKQMENGLIEVTPYEPEEFARLAGYTKPSEDAVLDKVYIQKVTPNELSKIDNLVTPYAIGPEIYIVKKGTSTGTGDLIATASSTCFSATCGKLAVSLNQTNSLEAGFSSNYSVGDASIISAGVGFNVTKSVSVGIQGTYEEENVPKNGKIYLQAYERLKIVGFEIWEDDIFNDDFLGSGSAWQPINEVQFSNWKTW